ncbi:MAG: MurR/RpiR family transcriptional regulator [Clostridiales bacterium]|jgi:DNA-binding MurR/RpiR family transcriptional regulator|nr:MurR/RpiR family transcriptional regulator [Clostridiales bacterium]
MKIDYRDYEDQITDIILEQYKLFTPAEKRVADYILTNPTAVILMTSSQLAKKIDVSEATIIRFSSRIGFSGFAEFKRSMQNAALSDRTLVKLERSVSKNVETADFFYDAMKNDLDNIQETINEMNPVLMEEACNLVCKSKRVFVVGSRRSAALADYLYFLLNIALDHVILLKSDAWEQLLNVDEKDCLISIGFKRYSKETVNLMQHFYNKKSKILAITDSPLSPLNNLADLSLKAAVESDTFMDSYTAAMSLINALVAYISKIQEKTLKDKLSKLEEIYKHNSVFYK